jgi:outer membrane protein OmpA-like peptidoglycan-associated protein
VPVLALEPEREQRAPTPAPEALAPELLAPARDSCEGLAALPPALRAGAVTAMQRGEGNAAVARMLSRVAELPKPEPGRAGETCKCGGTIGADGLCDKCRGERTAGLQEAAAGLGGAAGDGAIARLLAADLAARSASPPAPTLLRQTGPDAGGIDASAAGGEGCSTRCGDIPAACPPSFCCPFPLGTATLIRDQLRVPFLAAIASQVTPAVVPVWLMWFNGGVGMQNFTGRYGADFATDPTTTSVAPLVAADVAAHLDATQLQALAATATPGAPVSLLPALPADYATTTSGHLERDRDPMQMDFTTIGSVPGNLAGGVGKTQTACRVGATPGAVDDSRTLTDVTATLVRNPNGSITVTPTLHFRVVDTVDLCPGNCGSDIGVINEQLATIPMSRLEASGVCGDVPFTVEFPVAQTAFAVPPPAPPVPHHVVVSANTLFDFGSDRLRSGGEEALVAELGDRPTQADLTQPFAVEGHTDSKGSDEFNQGLSERRAATVVAVLERRYPNLAGHLHPSGFGESRPIAPNEVGGHDNPDGRAQNRRVELRFSAPPAP